MSPSLAWADAAEDLKAGRAALAAGDLEKARPLLSSAAQALPQSVEAQLALADVQLKSGNVEAALASYRRVLALSPDHAQAKRIVEALTGQTQTIASRLAAAKSLISLSAWPAAETLLTRLLTEPLEASNRNEARLLLAQARLWNNQLDLALAEAVRLIEEAAGTETADEARMVVVLAMLAKPEPAPRKALAWLKDLPAEAADKLRARWQVQLAELLGDFRSAAPAGDAAAGPEGAAAVSAKLAPLFEKMPASPYHTALLDNLAKVFIAIAQARLDAGDSAAALAIVWPMVGDGKPPGAEAVLKPVELGGGWLDHQGDTGAMWGYKNQVCQILRGIGRAEFAAQGSSASLLGHWLAAEVLRQTQPLALRPIGDELLKLAAELGSLVRLRPDRKPGEPLSRADEIAEKVLLEAAARTTDDSQRVRLFDLIRAIVYRYGQVDEIETGLKRFVVFEKPTPKTPIETVRLVAPLERLPAGSAQHRLLVGFGNLFAELAKKAFERAAATQAADANSTLGRFDAFALQLYGRAAAQYPDENSEATKAANEIIERYVAAERWQAASDAMRHFYAPLASDARGWASIHFRLRQAAAQEDKSLAANRSLGKALPPLVAEALAELRKIVDNSTTESTRNKAIAVADALVARYSQLQRPDLSEAAIAALVDKDGGGPLADWAIWQRANLLGQHADQALAAMAASSDDRRTMTVAPDFIKQVDMLGKLITAHPRSKYVPAAIDRILAISRQYQGHEAHDAAVKLLQDFLKAHPKLAKAPEIDFRVAQILVDKASLGFRERKDKLKPPAELSAEFVAAIDALAAIIKARPADEFAPAIEGQMLSLARLFGEAGAWPLSRQVLARFAAAATDYRSPRYLKYLEAITYLGELDAAYALRLLTPQAPRPTTKPGEADAASLAIKVASDLEKKLFDEAGERAAVSLIDNASAIPTPSPLTSTNATGALPKTPASPNDFFADGSLPPGGGASISAPKPASESSLAMARVRESESRGLAQIAMFDDQRMQAQAAEQQDAPSGSIKLPSGTVLSETEMKRQDTAADKAYAILLELAKSTAPSESYTATLARAQIHWLFGFFEQNLRADRAAELIRQYLKDLPTEPAKIALLYRAINDRLVFAAQRQATDRIDQKWLDQRHTLFEAARKELNDFISTHDEKANWSNQARLLLVESYVREADLVAPTSAVRAGGLLVQASEALVALLQTAPEHPECVNFPQRLWILAERLQSLRQQDPAVYVFALIPKHFPTTPQAHQAILKIAETFAANLLNPLRAVETYQEYLSLAGDNPAIRAQIFSIAQSLAGQQRYLEALHVYGVFVDSFPTDARAAEALQAIGQTHQANEAWEEAIAAYARVLAEYPGVAITPQVKLAVAECHINLSHWKEARKLYAEFVEAYPNDPQAALAKSRMEILKNVDRYQTLLADDDVQRNKDDAQFQIGRIVLERLQNPVKAVVEFRKVVRDYPKSDLADDAQFEIGKALLGQNKLALAREELLKVPANFPSSPLSDDALYLVGQSYERQAQRLAQVTIEKAKAEAFEQNQRGAYQVFNDNLSKQTKDEAVRRSGLKAAGKSQELELSDASLAFRQGSFGNSSISVSSREALLKAETESALQVANRQDRINEANRQAVAMYTKVAADYPLGDMTDKSLLRMAQIFETELKDRDAAMKTYQKVVKFFPGTPVAEDAAWKVAMFYEQEGKYTEAVAAYREFIRNYPASSRVADAQFAMAESLEQLGRWVEAMDAYETFRQKFTGHAKAQVAQEQINWIKAYRK